MLDDVFIASRLACRPFVELLVPDLGTVCLVEITLQSLPQYGKVHVLTHTCGYVSDLHGSLASFTTLLNPGRSADGGVASISNGPWKLASSTCAKHDQHRNELIARHHIDTGL